MPSVKVAAIQVAPVYLDLEGSVDKAASQLESIFMQLTKTRNA